MKNNQPTLDIGIFNNQAEPEELLKLATTSKHHAARQSPRRSRFTSLNNPRTRKSTASLNLDASISSSVLSTSSSLVAVPLFTSLVTSTSSASLADLSSTAESTVRVHDSLSESVQDKSLLYKDMPLIESPNTLHDPSKNHLPDVHVGQIQSQSNLSGSSKDYIKPQEKMSIAKALSHQAQNTALQSQTQSHALQSMSQNTALRLQTQNKESTISTLYPKPQNKEARIQSTENKEQLNSGQRNRVLDGTLHCNLSVNKSHPSKNADKLSISKKLEEFSSVKLFSNNQSAQFVQSAKTVQQAPWLNLEYFLQDPNWLKLSKRHRELYELCHNVLHIPLNYEAVCLSTHVLSALMPQFKSLNSEKVLEFKELLLLLSSTQNFSASSHLFKDSVNVSEAVLSNDLDLLSVNSVAASSVSISDCTTFTTSSLVQNSVLQAPINQEIKHQDPESYGHITDLLQIFGLPKHQPWPQIQSSFDFSQSFSSNFSSLAEEHQYLPSVVSIAQRYSNEASDLEQQLQVRWVLKRGKGSPLWKHIHAWQHLSLDKTELLDPYAKEHTKSQDSQSNVQAALKDQTTLKLNDQAAHSAKSNQDLEVQQSSSQYNSSSLNPNLGLCKQAITNSSDNLQQELSLLNQIKKTELWIEIHQELLEQLSKLPEQPLRVTYAVQAALMLRLADNYLHLSKLLRGSTSCLEQAVDLWHRILLNSANFPEYAAAVGQHNLNLLSQYLLNYNHPWLIPTCTTILVDVTRLMQQVRDNDDSYLICNQDNGFKLQASNALALQVNQALSFPEFKLNFVQRVQVFWQRFALLSDKWLSLLEYKAQAYALAATPLHNNISVPSTCCTVQKLSSQYNAMSQQEFHTPAVKTHNLNIHSLSAPAPQAESSALAPQVLQCCTNTSSINHMSSLSISYNVSTQPKLSINSSLNIHSENKDREVNTTVIIAAAAKEETNLGIQDEVVACNLVRLDDIRAESIRGGRVGDTRVEAKGQLEAVNCIAKISAFKEAWDNQSWKESWPNQTFSITWSAQTFTSAINVNRTLDGSLELQAFKEAWDNAPAQLDRRFISLNLTFVDPILSKEWIENSKGKQNGYFAYLPQWNIVGDNKAFIVGTNKDNKENKALIGANKVDEGEVLGEGDLNQITDVLQYSHSHIDREQNIHPFQEPSQQHSVQLQQSPPSLQDPHFAQNIREQVDIQKQMEIENKSLQELNNLTALIEQRINQLLLEVSPLFGIDLSYDLSRGCSLLQVKLNCGDDKLHCGVDKAKLTVLLFDYLIQHQPAELTNQWKFTFNQQHAIANSMFSYVPSSAISSTIMGQQTTEPCGSNETKLQTSEGVSETLCGKLSEKHLDHLYAKPYEVLNQNHSSISQSNLVDQLNSVNLLSSVSEVSDVSEVLSVAHKNYVAHVNPISSVQEFHEKANQGLNQSPEQCLNQNYGHLKQGSFGQECLDRGGLELCQDYFGECLGKGGLGQGWSFAVMRKASRVTEIKKRLLHAVTCHICHIDEHQSFEQSSELNLAGNATKVENTIESEVRPNLKVNSKQRVFSNLKLLVEPKLHITIPKLIERQLTAKPSFESVLLLPDFNDAASTTMDTDTEYLLYDVKDLISLQQAQAYAMCLKSSAAARSYAQTVDITEPVYWIAQVYQSPNEWRNYIYQGQALPQLSPCYGCRDFQVYSDSLKQLLSQASNQPQAFYDNDELNNDVVFVNNINSVEPAPTEATKVNSVELTNSNETTLVRQPLISSAPDLKLSETHSIFTTNIQVREYVQEPVLDKEPINELDRDLFKEKAQDKTLPLAYVETIKPDLAALSCSCSNQDALSCRCSNQSASYQYQSAVSNARSLYLKELNHKLNWCLLSFTVEQPNWTKHVLWQQFARSVYQKPRKSRMQWSWLYAPLYPACAYSHPDSLDLALISGFPVYTQSIFAQSSENSLKLEPKPKLELNSNYRLKPETKSKSELEIKFELSEQEEHINISFRVLKIDQPLGFTLSNVQKLNFPWHSMLPLNFLTNECCCAVYNSAIGELVPCLLPDMTKLLSYKTQNHCQLPVVGAVTLDTDCAADWEVYGNWMEYVSFVDANKAEYITQSNRQGQNISTSANISSLALEIKGLSTEIRESVTKDVSNGNQEVKDASNKELLRGNKEVKTTSTHNVLNKEYSLELVIFAPTDSPNHPTHIQTVKSVQTIQTVQTESKTTPQIAQLVTQVLAKTIGAGAALNLSSHLHIVQNHAELADLGLTQEDLHPWCQLPSVLLYYGFNMFPSARQILSQNILACAPQHTTVDLDQPLLQDIYLNWHCAPDLMFNASCSSLAYMMQLSGVVSGTVAYSLHEPHSVQFSKKRGYWQGRVLQLLETMPQVRVIGVSCGVCYDYVDILILEHSKTTCWQLQKFFSSRVRFFKEALFKAHGEGSAWLALFK